MRIPLSLRAAMLLGLLGTPALTPAQEPTSEASTPPAVDSITDQEIQGHLRFLASDLMRGRDTASPEIKIASEYLATRLLMFGAEPAGDVEDGEPTYFAHFPLEFTTPKTEGTHLTLIVEHDDARREIPCAINRDFVVFPRGLAAGTIEAPVVFAGYGRDGEGDEPNDFEGLNVEDRFVLVLDGTPPDQDAEGLRERRRRGLGARVDDKRRAAEERGALGLLVIHPFDDDDLPPYAESRASAVRMFDRPSMTLGAASTDAEPILYLEDSIRDAIDEVIELSESPAEPRPLSTLKARFSFAAETITKRDRNVIGLFPGSDPDMRNEVVIFSAHYDHVGVGADGQIYNGADDNASGTSGLLEIAEAFSSGPRPARSVALLWVSGEEKGLLGSRWFADHMTLPGDLEIVADINIDMISRNDPYKVSLTPSPEHDAYSTLVPAAVASCKAEGMEPVFDADQFFHRTDSYNFAQKDIPVIFFFSGLHEDYHQPGDDFEKADPAKAARIARIAYRLGWTIAEDSERPHTIEAQRATPENTADEVDGESAAASAPAMR